MSYSEQGPEFASLTPVRYVCGECDYDQSALWPVHQAHYEAHVEGRARRANYEPNLAQRIDEIVAGLEDDEDDAEIAAKFAQLRSQNGFSLRGDRG